MSTAWTSRYAQRAKNLKSSAIRELLKITQHPEIISFAGGLPAPDVFPTERFREACDRVLEKQARLALQYGATEGYEPLREMIVDIASEARVASEIRTGGAICLCRAAGRLCRAVCFSRTGRFAATGALGRRRVWPAVEVAPWLYVEVALGDRRGTRSDRATAPRPPRICVHRPAKGGRAVSCIRCPRLGRGPAMEPALASRRRNRSGRRRPEIPDRVHRGGIVPPGSRPGGCRPVRLAGLRPRRPRSARLHGLRPCRPGFPRSGVPGLIPAAGPGRVSGSAIRGRSIGRLPSGTEQVLAWPVRTRRHIPVLTQPSRRAVTAT